MFVVTPQKVNSTSHNVHFTVFPSDDLLKYDQTTDLIGGIFNFRTRLDMSSLYTCITINMNCTQSNYTLGDYIGEIFKSKIFNGGQKSYKYGKKR